MRSGQVEVRVRDDRAIRGVAEMKAGSGVMVGCVGAGGVGIGCKGWEVVGCRLRCRGGIAAW